MIETAIFVPLATLCLFAVIWAMQLGTIDERTQIAVRYSGLISQVQSPYDDYSLYATYNNLTATDYEKNPPLGCSSPGVAPTTDALSNNNVNNTFPGPISGLFWWNTSDSGNGTCNATNARAVITGPTQKEIVLYNGPQMVATINVPSFLQSALGATSSVSATTNFYKAPNIQAIMRCYNNGSTTDLQDMAQASFQPWINQGPTPTAIPTPYPAAGSPVALQPSAGC